MRVTEIDVPKGCSKIYVDIEDGKLVISYGSKANEVQVYCNETQRHEDLPGMGDFAVFWDNKSRNHAICASLAERTEDGEFVTSDDVTYDNAVKFRDLKQYLEIRGIYEEQL